MSDRIDMATRVDQLNDESRIRILLEEYRALYGLLSFRLYAMNRRVPLAGGVLWGLLGSATVMPPETKLVFLVGLPAALLWLQFSTVQHARSKEDHLRRIDEIERLVNCLAGEELLVYQSRHPNNSGPTSGRTGLATVRAVLSAGVTMLAGCAYLAARSSDLLPAWVHVGYHAWVAVCGLLMVRNVMALRRYRYRRSPMRLPPIFESGFRHA